MDTKKIAAVIGAADVVLLVICLIFYLGRDRKGPEIFFNEENQIVYSDGIDEELLLDGVTAVDEKDGDVSDSLLVEKVAGTNGKEVIVTYVARDSSNNVGKASRAFTVASNYKGGDVLPVEAEIFETEDDTVIEPTTEIETESGMESSPSDRETGREEINKDENNEDSIAGANPVLILNSDVINTKKGTAPNCNEVIEIMSDDKDDYNTLYNNLKLVGQVKLNEEGDYPVTLYTIDTDGNKSENKNLIVKVN